MKIRVREVWTLREPGNSRYGSVVAPQELVQWETDQLYQRTDLSQSRNSPRIVKAKVHYYTNNSQPLGLIQSPITTVYSIPILI